MDYGHLSELWQNSHLHGLSLAPWFQTVWSGAQRSCRRYVLAHHLRSGHRHRQMRCLTPKSRLQLSAAVIDEERQVVALLRIQARLRFRGEPTAWWSYWQG